MKHLKSHVPELGSGRGWIIAAMALAAFLLASAALGFIDRLWPAWSGVGQVALILLGFLWTAPFFWRRREYRQRWGDLAYRNAFGRHVLIGLPMIFAAVIHTVYLPGERIASGAALTVLGIMAVYFFATGFLLWLRAAFTFGFDNLAMLYVYFPEKGRLVASSIYAVIRHPVYSGVIRMGLALGLWRATGFSIGFGLFMPVGLGLWLRLVEEPELVERFGDGYVRYQRRVPAFWPRAKEIGKFLRFLFEGEEEGGGNLQTGGAR